MDKLSARIYGKTPVICWIGVALLRDNPHVVARYSCRQFYPCLYCVICHVEAIAVWYCYILCISIVKVKGRAGISRNPCGQCACLPSKCSVIVINTIYSRYCRSLV